jgi:cytochrome c553
MKKLQDLSFAVACTATGIVFAAALAVPAQAADLDAGKQKADQVCAACHGADGNTPIDPSYPKLAGQHREYLERTLLDYQAGRRKNPIMAAQAKALSREDIENVTAYYASLPGQLRVRR